MSSAGHLLAARDMLANAKRDLCMAISAFERVGGFDSTIAQLKQTIGDLECALFEMDNQ